MLHHPNCMLMKRDELFSSLTQLQARAARARTCAPCLYTRVRVRVHRLVCMARAWHVQVEVVELREAKQEVERSGAGLAAAMEEASEAAAEAKAALERARRQLAAELDAARRAAEAAAATHEATIGQQAAALEETRAALAGCRQRLADAAMGAEEVARMRPNMHPMHVYTCASG